MQEKIRTMKNTHVLPTDKASIIHKALDNYFYLSATQTLITKLNKAQPINLYITSDEEIKVGDWYYNPYTNQLQIKDIFDFGEDCKKIILTTNQDLIKDGVQAINNEFLEWFVKNPSCEEVEVLKNECNYDEYRRYFNHKIIIPEEEPFKHELRVLSKEEVLANRSSAYEFIDFDKQETLEEDSLNHFLSTSNIIVKDIKDYDFKQETLEEAAEKFAKNFGTELDSNSYYAFIFGAKWQQEQIGKSGFLQKLRKTISDAEARRLIFEQFKK